MKKITADFNKIPVLVIDDYLINLELTKHMLELMKCQVDTAVTGEEALQQVGTKEYAIIFLDIQMPDMDGIEIAKKIRALRNGKKQIPIVALTANALAGDREKYLKNGMDDYLSKPITGEQIENVIKRQLQTT